MAEMTETPTTTSSEIEGGEAALLRVTETQRALIADLSATVESLRGEKEEVARLLTEQIEKLRSQVEWLTRQQFGRKSEKIDPNQMWLDALTIQAVEGNAPAAPAPAAETEVAAHTRKAAPHGRGELPATLERVVEVVDVPESEKTLPDGTPRPLIGCEDAERVAYEPPKIYVKVTRRLKYGSPAGAEENGVVTAPVPDALVPCCLADESLVAHLAVSKYSDHQPLNRMEGVLKRSGVTLARQTTCGWLVEHGLAVQPLADEIARRIFEGRLAHHDDTPVDMQDYDSGKPRGERMRETRLWVTTAPPREGPWTVFDFTVSRAADGPRDFLKDFHGWLVCDAYGGYRALASAEEGPPALRLAGCWAHARRHFLDAHKTSHPAQGAEFLHLIRLLYEVERAHADTAPPDAAGGARASGARQDPREDRRAAALGPAVLETRQGPRVRGQHLGQAHGLRLRRAPAHRQQRGRADDPARRPRPLQLAVLRQRARRPGGSQLDERHRHLQARGRRALRLSIGRPAPAALGQDRQRRARTAARRLEASLSGCCLPD